MPSTSLVFTIKDTVVAPASRIRVSSDTYEPWLGATAFCRSFFFNDTATTEIYTLSLHDALPIRRLGHRGKARTKRAGLFGQQSRIVVGGQGLDGRSEEHTSELQSHLNLVCR